MIWNNFLRSTVHTHTAKISPMLCRAVSVRCGANEYRRALQEELSRHQSYIYRLVLLLCCHSRVYSRAQPRISYISHIMLDRYFAYPWCSGCARVCMYTTGLKFRLLLNASPFPKLIYRPTRHNPWKPFSPIIPGLNLSRIILYIDIPFNFELCTEKYSSVLLYSTSTIVFAILYFSAEKMRISLIHVYLSELAG